MRLLREASEWQRRVYAEEHAAFKAEHGTPGIVGTRGEYQWLTLADGDIASLLSICPEVVLGKYLAVTSIDSGPLCLTDNEVRAGWWTSESSRVFQQSSWGPPEYRNDWKVAWSPQITSVQGLPHETHDECCAGFEEWYVFDRQVTPQDMESFVNWTGFVLYEPSFDWCMDRLWQQFAKVEPESYISDGTIFTFVTRNPALFQCVLSGYLASQDFQEDPSWLLD